MAKKRRKSTRQRTQQAQGRTAMQTAEHPDGSRPSPPAEPARPVHHRAERKELARAEREAARKRIARAERARRAIWAGGIALLIGTGVLFLTRDTSTTSSTGPLPGELTTKAPWPANADQLQARVDAIGLPPEGTVMHIHANLRIFVHGKAQPVPADVGIDGSSDPALVASLHTHEGSGTIHIESSKAQAFTLGDFFDVWGVRLTGSCMGAYCNDPTNALQVFVDGQEVSGDPREVRLEDQQVVVITYGTADELPDPIPATFDFSSIPQ